MPELRQLHTAEEAHGIRPLVHEYLESELEKMHAISGLTLNVADFVNVTFDRIDAFLPPNGVVLLVTCVREGMLGCVFFSKLGPDAGEIKRFYVRPAARRKGIGRRLIEALLAEARSLGARRVLLDTTVYNHEAHAIYRSLGFVEIEPYPEGQNDPRLMPYFLYMQCEL